MEGNRDLGIKIMRHYRFTPLYVLILVFCLPKAIAANPKDSHDQLLRAAATYQHEGFTKKALPLLFKAQSLSSELSPEGQMRSHLALGRLYFELGEYPLSLEQLNRVLTLNPGAYTEANALNTIATTHSTLNSPQEADRTFTKAISQAASIKNDTLTLTILTNQLRHNLSYGRKSVSRGLLPETWQFVSKLDATISTAEINISLATLYQRAVSESEADQQWHQRALELLDQAIKISAQQGNIRLQSYALGYKAQLMVDNDNLTEALALAKSASFLANSIQAYESAYLWDWQIARIYQRQNETFDAIQSYKHAISTLENVRQKLINGSPFTFHQKVQPLFTELSDILLTTALTASASEKQSYLKNVQSILEQAKSAELQDYFQNDCVIPDESINLDQIEPATAVIYPVILDDRVEMLVNIRDQVHQFVSPIPSTDLEQLVNEFRDHLQEDAGDEEYLEIGEELYDLLFKQVETLFASNNIDTLLVIPDGVLRTVPMSAIYDGEKFLVQRFAIATTPGISLTLPKPLDVSQSNLFAGGISDAVQGFVGLPGVPKELQNLEKNYGASILQDTQFRRSDLTEQLSSADFSIVHIATHGHFDSNPQKSYLLTYDDKLTMDLLEQSIGSRRNTAEPLELLVLSACESAAGDSRAALGLAGVALKAGARSAVATLWQISDAATVQIINGFYANVTTQNITKAKALQLAQINLINQDEFRHPTDWAPFLMIGNWL